MIQKIRSNLLMFVDIILLNISLFTAYILRFDGWGVIPEQYLSHYVYLAVMSTLVKIICLFGFRLYKSLWQYAGVSELVSVFFAALTGNVIMEAVVFVDYAITKTLLVPRSVFVISFFMDVSLVGGVRLLYRIARRFAKGESIRFTNGTRVMIIGGGDAGAAIIKEMRNNLKPKYQPVVIIDDDTHKHGMKINGVPIVGGREIISEVVHKKKIDEIIIAISAADKKDLNEIYAECSKTSCKVKLLPSMSQLINQTVTLQRVRDVSIEDLLGREPIKLECNDILDLLKGKTVLVTGGGGSIGSELCRQICEYEPASLVILDNYENSLFEIHHELEYKHPNLKIIPVVANIRERSRICDVFEIHRPEVVFHAAAHKHVPLMELNPTEAIRNNMNGTLIVTDACETYGVRRFVLISSDKAVNPTNVMGASKRIAEMWVQTLNAHSRTDYVAVRFGNVLGSSGSVVPLFKKQIEMGGPVTVTHPDVIRYFMTIPEAVQLVLQAGAMAEGGEIFVLDMGKPVKIYDLAKNLIKLSGFEPDVDIKIEFIGLRPGEKLFEELLLNEEGMQATKHDRIYVAKPVEMDINVLINEMMSLERLAEKDSKNVKAVLKYMTKLVPNFHHTPNSKDGKAGIEEAEGAKSEAEGAKSEAEDLIAASK